MTGHTKSHLTSCVLWHSLVWTEPICSITFIYSFDRVVPKCRRNFDTVDSVDFRTDRKACLHSHWQRSCSVASGTAAWYPGPARPNTVSLVRQPCPDVSPSGPRNVSTYIWLRHLSQCDHWRLGPSNSFIVGQHWETCESLVDVFVAYGSLDSQEDFCYYSTY